MEYFRIYETLPGRTPVGFGEAGGRWNAPGVPMIYAARYTALNLLEMICIRGSVVSSVRWSLAVFEIDRDIPELDAAYLPPDWNRLPYPDSTVVIGSAWCDEGSGPFLKVPSARLPENRFPEEHNLLINPLHPDAFALTCVKEVTEVGFLLNH